MIQKFSALATAGLVALCATSVLAAGPNGRPLTVEDPIVSKECGDCHMVFPPSKLTKGGWHKIMGDLANHFGDDASLDAATVQHIDAYLAANALDAKGGIRTEMRLKAWAKKGIVDPIRITETPEWTRHHTAKANYRKMAEDVGYTGGSNCKKCHKNAEYGLYEDFGE